MHSLFIRPSDEPVLRLLYCHYLFDHQRKQFEAVIRYLQSIGDFISTDRVLDVLHGRETLRRNYFHLSFDDGMKNVAENALPILRDLGVPAIMFVPTMLVSTPPGAFPEIRRILVTTDVGAEIVTWSDLEKIHEAGFDVGSHTRSHARLLRVQNSAAAIEDEVFGSKADLESHLGVECRYISWPYGRRQDLDDGVVEIVQRAGYKACFGAFRGHIEPKITSAFRIPRHHIEPEWPRSHVKCFALGAWES